MLAFALLRSLVTGNAAVFKRHTGMECKFLCEVGVRYNPSDTDVVTDWVVAGWSAPDFWVINCDALWELFVGVLVWPSWALQRPVWCLCLQWRHQNLEEHWNTLCLARQLKHKLFCFTISGRLWWLLIAVHRWAAWGPLQNAHDCGPLSWPLLCRGVLESSKNIAVDIDLYKALLLDSRTPISLRIADMISRKIHSGVAVSLAKFCLTSLG